MKRFLSLIGNHIRNIDVLYFKKKIVFQIPLHDDILLKYHEVKITDEDISIIFTDTPSKKSVKGLKEKKDLSNQ